MERAQAFLALPGALATGSDDCELLKLGIVVEPDMASAESGRSPGRWSLMLPAGPHHIEVTAFDATGKQGKAGIDITVDPSAPPGPRSPEPPPPVTGARCTEVTGPATGSRGCSCKVGGGVGDTDLDPFGAAAWLLGAALVQRRPVRRRPRRVPV